MWKIDITLAALLARPIEKLELTRRAYNGLKRSGVITLADVFAKMETGEIFNIRGIGEKTIYEILTEVKRYLKRYGYEVEDEA